MSPPPARAWFSAEELCRSGRFHRRRFRVQALCWVGGLATLLVMAAVGPPWDHATGARADLAAAVVLAATMAPFEAVSELWRGLAERTPASAPRSVTVVAVLAEVAVRLPLRVVSLAPALIVVQWWLAADRWVAFVVLPMVAVVLTWCVAQLVGWWRTCHQGLTPVPAGPALEVLVTLERRHHQPGGSDADAEAPSSGRRPVSWWVNADRAAERATAGRTWVWRGRQHVALDPAVLAGGRALLEVVAAHELTHGAPPPRHRWASGTRWGGAPLAGFRVAGLTVGLPVAGVAILVRWGLGPGPLPMTRVLVAAATAVTLSVPWELIAAARSRRHELVVDRLASVLLSDPAASTRAVRDLLVRAEVDLDPVGLRGWFADHPPPASRLAVSAVCQTCELTGPDR
ncbi:MAG: hypothetical protein ACKV2O_12910 [Acidimicrobiales bacterium]